MSIFGTKNRATRGCASKLACGRRIAPAGRTVFYGNLRRIRTTLQILNAGRFYRFSPVFSGKAEKIVPPEA